MEHEPQYDAPPKLAEAFKQLRSKTVFVPRSVDDAVLDAARERLEGAARPGRRPWIAWPGWIKAPVLAAAALALIVAARYFVTPQQTRYAREDVNRDGQVNILDAFDLARQLKAGIRPVGLDLNGDGVVDRIDAEIIAREAVSLEKGGRS